MSVSGKINSFIFSIVALFASVAAANAATITGTFNANSYQTFSLNVATAATVDFQYLSGYYDPNFMLFNDAGSHLVTNDDSVGVYSRITQNLAAGNYTLLVTYCCNGVNALEGERFSATDGFNIGSYYFGGTSTLGSVEAYLNDPLNAYSDLRGTEF
jgi:hypothetical protein